MNLVGALLSAALHAFLIILGIIKKKKIRISLVNREYSVLLHSLYLSVLGADFYLIHMEKIAGLLFSTHKFKCAQM